MTFPPSHLSPGARQPSRVCHALRNPPRLPKPLCFGFPSTGNSPAPGVHPGTRRDEQGPAGTRCTSSGRVYAKVWHCFTKMRWALPALPVIAPGAKEFAFQQGRIPWGRGKDFERDESAAGSPVSPGLGGGGSGDRSWEGMKGPSGGCTSLVLLGLGHEGSRALGWGQTEHSDAQYGHRGLDSSVCPQKC